MKSETYDRVAVASQPRPGAVGRALAWIRRFVTPDAPAGWSEIRLYAAGFSVDGVDVAWSGITAIGAFERELLGFDGLWLQVSTDAGDTVLCELQPGFGELAAALDEGFPGVAGWEARVVGSGGALIPLYHRA